MEDKTLQKKGLLGNFLNGKFWDSKSTSANVTKRELWLGYVAGPFGVMLLQSLGISYFNQFLTDVLGFTVSRGAWIALFMVWFPILSKLIDAVTNLLMAKLLDLTTCRQGKLRPWFILSLPIVVVSILLMFWIPVQSVVAQAVWIVISYNLFYSVGYTMWYMAYEMSASLSTRNVKQRSTNSMAGQITKNMGTGIISITFPLILTGVCGLVGGENQPGYLLTMAIICCIAVPLTFLQYFYTRERVTEERRNQFQGSTEVKKVEEASFLTQLKACLKDKYWIMLVVMILTYQVLNALKSVSQVYYSGWVVQGNSYGTYASIQARDCHGPHGAGPLLRRPHDSQAGPPRHHDHRRRDEHVGLRRCLYDGGQHRRRLRRNRHQRHRHHVLHVQHEHLHRRLHRPCGVQPGHSGRGHHRRAGGLRP